MVNVLTALLTLLSIVLYAGVYTPLKRKTAFCTAIGAIPGALPPVLGWTATGNSLDVTAFALFAIVFLWQFPHFFAIAWLYRDQYSAAGLRMLPADGRGHITGWLAFAYALCLVPVGLIPSATGMAGTSAALMTVLLGLLYAGASLNFLWNENRASARNLLLVSLVYLPTVLLSVTMDHWRLLNL
jgi:protoheme IX farnesyltransferase